MAKAAVLALAVVAVALVVAAPLAEAAFYLPGVPPVAYATNTQVQMQVNKLTSTKTQLPFRYYALPFCAPDVVVEEDLNLGEILSGDQIENSMYELFVKFNQYCKVLCARDYTEEEAKQFDEKIRDDYTVHWIMDNLPAAVRLVDEEDPDEVIYQRGFRLGFVDEDSDVTYLYNHIRFVIKYNGEEDEAGARIVGFEVEPFSVRHSYEGKFDLGQTQLRTCNDAQHVHQNMEKQRIDQAGQVIFTYDVKWEESSIQWTDRWDLYLKGNTDDEVHWFSIINSLLVVLLLTGMIAMILIRALNKDIARYNDETALEEAAEETGWKLVHGDVFRPPQGTFGPMMLATFVGSGIQIAMMAATVMVFALLGFLSPAKRGGMMTALLLLYVFNGSFAGYYSARLYKMFGGKARTRATLLTAVMYPSAVFSIGFTLNFFVWSRGSSAAIPFGTMFALLVLWLGVSTPLVFAGSYFGYRKEEVKNPVRTKEIERHIPEQPWYLTTVPTVLVGGVLPFGAIFIELFFIMSNIWQEQTYYVFGFLILALIILVATCAEISIVMCYFQLCAENHRWWWRAFLTSGSSALYMYLYSALYFATKLEITDFVAGLMYFSYMGIVSVTFFLLTGTIGFLACLTFVRQIYAAIKID